MAAFDKSDDSGDSDFDPHRPHATGKKPSAKKSRKAGASSLPTPGVTPTETETEFSAQTLRQHRDSIISTQFAAQPLAPRQPYPQLQSPPSFLPPPNPPSPSPSPSPSPAFAQHGILDFEDEVLAGQLNFSRRGRYGHCSRDTADIWLYVLRLFFPMDQGYEMVIRNYQEQTTDDFFDQDAIPSGNPVMIQLWHTVKQFHPLARQWVYVASTPVLTVVCGSAEAGFSEFPAVRHKKSMSLDVQVHTSFQHVLYNHLHSTLQQHNLSVTQGRNHAQYIKTIDGVVACGTTVRFFKAHADQRGNGYLKALTPRGQDLVNGVPSEAMAQVERILSKIKDSGKKGRY